jgi:hypothetical protein
MQRTLLSAVLAVPLIASVGCSSPAQKIDPVPPGAEKGGAGADGNNSAPDSLSNGGADPNTTPMTEPSTATPDPSTGTPPPTDAAAAPK